MGQAAGGGEVKSFVVLPLGIRLPRLIERLGAFCLCFITVLGHDRILKL
jgi:hypothetical protein